MMLTLNVRELKKITKRALVFLLVFALFLTTVPPVAFAAGGGSTAGQLTVYAGSGIKGYDVGEDDGLHQAKDAMLDTPNNIVMDSNGNLYISHLGDSGSYIVRKVDTSCIISTLLSGGFPCPGGGLAVDASDNLYIANGEQPRILKYSSGSIIPLSATGFFPHEVAVNKNNGDIYFTDNMAHNDYAAFKVTDYDSDPLTDTAPVPASNNLGLPLPVTMGGIAVDSHGFLYVADTAGQLILKINPANGTFDTFAGKGSAGFSGDGGTATDAELNFPESVAVDSLDNVYIADTNNHRIRKVDIEGNITTVAGDGTIGDPVPGPATASPFQSPTGITVGPNGNIYIADKEANQILEVVVPTAPVIDPNGGSFSTSGSMNINISASLEASQAIYYTTDGTLPTTASISATTPQAITLSFGTTTVKAAVHDSVSDLWSKVTSAIFTVSRRHVVPYIPPVTAPSATTYAASDVNATVATLNGSASYIPGSELTDSGFQWGPSAGSLQQTSTGSGSSLTLSLTGLKENTTYYFRAYATNTAGTSYGSTLSFKTPPTPLVVNTQGATDISLDTAVIHGNLTGGGTITSSGFTISPGFTGDMSAALNADGSFSLTLNGLKPGMIYSFKAFATNEAGRITGLTKNFITLKTKPEVETLAVDKIIQTSATLNGYILNSDKFKITDSGFLWGTDYNLGKKAVAAPGTDKHTLSFSLTGLKPETTYYVQSYATNLAGTGYGSMISFKTLSYKPEVETREPSDITQTEATLKSYILKNNDLPITDSGFLWGTDKSPDKKISVKPGTDQHSLSSLVKGLKPSQTYYFQGYATNSAGTGFGDVVSFTALDNFPDVVTQEPEEIDNFKATLNGVITNNYGLPIKDKGFLWGKDPKPDKKVSLKLFGTREFFTTIAELEADTKYYYQAYATSSAGTGYGDVVSFTTMNNAPVVETRPIDEITPGSGELNGYILKNRGYLITESGFLWGTDPDPDNKVTTRPGKDMRTLTYSLSRLRGGTTYYIQAYAASKMGVGFGEVLSFTTMPSVKASVATLSADFDALNWQPVLKGSITFDGGAPVTDYGFRYGSDQKNWINQLVGQTNYIGEYTAQFSGQDRLPAGTYYAQAYAINSVGTSYGDILKFTTPSYPKVTLNVTNPIAGSTTAALAGTITDTGGQDVTCDTHQFQYRLAGKADWQTVDITQGSFGTSSFLFNLTILDPGTKYEFRAQVHNPAGWSDSPTVAFTTGWGQDDKEAAKNMKAAGYNAQKIADILNDIYKDAADAAIKALQYAEFTTNDIALALKSSTYKVNYSQLITAFKAVGLDVTEVAGALKQVFTLDMQMLSSGQLNSGLIRCLKNSGYSIDDIIIAVRKVLSYQLYDCASELKAGSLYAQNVVYAAIARAYGPDALADYLWSRCTHSPDYSFTWTDQTSLYPIARILREDAGLTAPKVVEILKRIYPTLNIEFLAKVFDGGGFGVTDTGSVMVQYFGSDPLAAAQAFNATYLDKNAIEEFLIKDMKSSPQDMVKIIADIMKGKFDYYTEVPRVLQVYYNMDAKASAACMYAAGYDLDRMIMSMDKYYHLTSAYDLIGVLKECGLAINQLIEKVRNKRDWLIAFRQQGFNAIDYIAYVKANPTKFWNTSPSWLNSFEGFKTQAAGVFYDLVKAGYGLTEIASGVKNLYGLDQSTALEVFMKRNGGSSMNLSNSDITAAVSEAYGADSIMGEIKKMISSGSSAAQIALSLKSSYSITDPEKVADYLVKSGYDEAKVLDALEAAFYSRSSTRDTIDKLFKIDQNVFKQNSIRNALNAVLKAVGNDPDAESIVRLLNKNGYSITEAAKIMKEDYSMTPFQIIDAYVMVLGMKKKTDIMTGVMAAFGIDPIPGYVEYRKSVGDSATLAIYTLNNLFGITDAEKTATYLAQASYSQSDVLSAILSEFYHNQASPDALKMLGDILLKVYNKVQGNMAEILKAANASDPSSAIGVLNKGGYTLGDIARVLKDVFSLTSTQAINELTKSGLFKQEDIAAQVQSIYGGDYVLLYLQYWKSLGYNSESCYYSMGENLGIKDAVKRFSFLKMAGFSENDSWKAVVSESRDEMMTVLKNAYGLYDPIAAGRQFKQIPILNDYYGVYELASGFKRAYPDISLYSLVKGLRAAGIPVDEGNDIFGWLRGHVKDGMKDDELIAILGTANPDDLGLRICDAVEIIHGKGYSLEEAAAWLLKDNYKWEDMFGYLTSYYAPKDYPQVYFANNSSSKFIVIALKKIYSIDDLAKGILGYQKHMCGQSNATTQMYAAVYSDLISADYSIDESVIAIIKLGENAVSSLVSIMVDESISRSILYGKPSLRLNAVTVADKLYQIGTTTPGISFSMIDIARGLVEAGPGAGEYNDFTLGDVYSASRLITGKYLQRVGSDAPVDITALHIMRLAGLTVSDAAAMLADDGVGLSTGSIIKSIFGLGSGWTDAVIDLAGAGYSASDSISAIYCNKDYHMLIGLSILSTITTKAISILNDGSTVVNILLKIKRIAWLGFKLDSSL